MTKPYEQTEFERKIHIIGDRVLLKLHLQETGGRIQIPEKCQAKFADSIIVARGDGPNMDTKYQLMQPGVMVSVRNMGYHEITDTMGNQLYRLYSCEDIMALIPEGYATHLALFDTEGNPLRRTPPPEPEQPAIILPSN